MSEPGTPADAERQLGEEIDSVGRVWARTVELGRRGFTISVLIFVLLIMQVLPWAQGHAGWETLAGQAGGVPQLFAVTSTGVGVFIGAVALVSRRWWISWCAALGGWFASVDGLLAIWSQQSAHASGAAGGGPGIGMIVAWIATIALATLWMRTAFSRA